MKRKSNFDVTPEEFALMKQQAQAAAAALLQSHQQQPLQMLQQEMFGASPYQPQQPQMAQYGMSAAHSTPYAQPYLPPFEVHDQVLATAQCALGKQSNRSSFRVAALDSCK